MKVITIGNQKGGVAKTTTAAALWAAFYKHGKTALAIDLDPQRNLSDGVQAGQEKTVCGVLMGEITAEEAIQTINGRDIIAGAGYLAAADTLFTEIGKETRLKKALQPLKNKKVYDYIIIDTPPNLGILTVNALAAADAAIIPVQADIYSLAGLMKYYNTIEAIREYFTPELTVDGIVLTRYKPRTKLSRDINDLLNATAEKMHTGILQPPIRESIKAAEAPAQGMTLFDYAPNSTIAADYYDLAGEIIRKGGE